MNTQTPQTDAFIAGQEAGGISIWAALISIQNHARTLEAERNHYKALCEELREALQRVSDLPADVTVDTDGEAIDKALAIARAALKKAEKDI